MIRRVALSLTAASLVSLALTSSPSAQIRESGSRADTLELRVVCTDEIALKLVDPNGHAAFSSRDSSSAKIPACELIRPYEDGEWEAGTEDSNLDSTEYEAPDTTKAKAGDRGFRVRGPKFGDWRLEASLPPIGGFIGADVWLNVRVKPGGSVLSDVDTGKSWVVLRPGQRANCTLSLGADGSLVRSRTKVSHIVPERAQEGRKP